MVLEAIRIVTVSLKIRAHPIEIVIVSTPAHKCSAVRVVSPSLQRYVTLVESGFAQSIRVALATPLHGAHVVLPFCIVMAVGMGAAKDIVGNLLVRKRNPIVRYKDPGQSHK